MIDIQEAARLSVVACRCSRPEFDRACRDLIRIAPDHQARGMVIVGVARCVLEILERYQHLPMATVFEIHDLDPGEEVREVEPVIGLQDMAAACGVWTAGWRVPLQIITTMANGDTATCYSITEAVTQHKEMGDAMIVEILEVFRSAVGEIEGKIKG